MANRISKLLIIVLCVFCIAFCGVSAKQSEQAQDFNSVIQKLLIGSTDTEIPERFQSVAFKTVVKSEVLGGKSNQNEFLGVRALKDIFGEDKQKFEATYIYFGDKKPLIAKGTATWYINQYQNGKPSFRLYYRKTPVSEAMEVGDLLFLGKTEDNKLFIIVVDNESPVKDKLIASFNIQKPAEKPVGNILKPPTIQPIETWYRVFFTPGTDCENNIISRINNAKYSVDIAVYSITNRNIVDAVIAAHKRGVKVRVITDKEQEKWYTSLVKELVATGISVRMNDADNNNKIEHNKFAIFDGKEVESGSFNWTTSATNCNSENCMFFKQSGKEFSDRYEYLWKTYAQ